MMVVTQAPAKSAPRAVREICWRKRRAPPGRPRPGAIDFLSFGVEACRPAPAMIINDALQQSLIERKIDVEEFFDNTTRALAA
jgi:hypothetical protein